MLSVYNAACINAEPLSLRRPLVEAVAMADRGYRVHRRWNVFGRGGKPSQGRIEEISEGGTIYRLDSPKLGPDVTAKDPGRLPITTDPHLPHVAVTVWTVTHTSPTWQ